MTRRKFEITGHMNERDFPHIIELELPPGGFRSQSLDFDAFHRERSILIRRGRGRHEGEQFRVRFCFPDAATAEAFQQRFGGTRLTYSPRVVGGKVMTPADLRRLHKYLLEIEHIDHISDEMRAVVENEWPELAHKLPPKK